MFCTLLGASREFSPSALIAFQSGGDAGLRDDCYRELERFCREPFARQLPRLSPHGVAADRLRPRGTCSSGPQQPRSVTPEEKDRVSRLGSPQTDSSRLHALCSPLEPSQWPRGRGKVTGQGPRVL